MSWPFAYPHARTAKSRATSILRIPMRSHRFGARTVVPLSICIFVPLLLAGCEARLVPVSGKVTLDNKPLTTGTVTLKPDKEKGNAAKVEPIGKIAEDGTYTIETNGKP